MPNHKASSDQTGYDADHAETSRRLVALERATTSAPPALAIVKQPSQAATMPARAPQPSAATFSGVSSVSSSDVSSGFSIAANPTSGAVILTPGVDTPSVARTTLGLGTSATHDVPASGNASVTQVVLGNDTRLGGGGGITPINENDISSLTPSVGDAWVTQDTDPANLVIYTGQGRTGYYYLPMQTYFPYDPATSAASWTWLNQNGATQSDSGNDSHLAASVTVGTNLDYLWQSPALTTVNPTTIDFVFQSPTFTGTASFQRASFGLSDGTHHLIMAINGNGQWQAIKFTGNWTSVVTISSGASFWNTAPFTTPQRRYGRCIWIGTGQVTFQYSLDEITWTTIYIVTPADTNLASGFSRAILGGGNDNSGTPPTQTAAWVVYGWRQE